MAAKRRKSKQPRYKSQLERRFAELCFVNGVKAQYEATRFEFVKIAHYNPDWKIHSKLYVETKGYFSPSNRSNLLSFREQHPDVEIFLVFSQPNNKLNSKSKTTYAQWCDSHGFRWCHIKDFPKFLWNENNNKGKQDVEQDTRSSS